MRRVGSVRPSHTHTHTHTHTHMSHFSYMCKMRYPLNLVLENWDYLWFYFLHCNFRLWFETTYAFDSYPCHASKMTRNTLNHCLKFALHSISCHICYGNFQKKFSTRSSKVKLLVSKASNSCFKGLDFFQMLLVSHR